MDAGKVHEAVRAAADTRDVQIGLHVPGEGHQPSEPGKADRARPVEQRLQAPGGAVTANPVVGRGFVADCRRQASPHRPTSARAVQHPDFKFSRLGRIDQAAPSAAK